MNDPRVTELTDWCVGVLGHRDFELSVASADASFRRYFRLHGPEGTTIVMDAPPERCGSVERFIQVAGMLREAGVHAPEILAGDEARGFLLLEDLGLQTYLDELNEANANQLMDDAIEVLVRMQGIGVTDAVPDYGQALLRAELALFPDWFIGRHQGIELAECQRDTLYRIFDMLERAALDQPRVFVHRDYMPRNLMVSDPNPGVIDFQDAVNGPVTYDLLSLLKDAFLSWPGKRVAAWVRQYRDKAMAANLPVCSDLKTFRRHFDWMGVQRHLKVIGIFARLCYRDGKPQYLKDTPRFFHYLYETGRRYPELKPLLQLLDELDSAEAAGRAPREAAMAGNTK